MPPIAQLVEQLPFKEKVVGSNPTGGIEHITRLDSSVVPARTTDVLPDCVVQAGVQSGGERPDFNLITNLPR